MSYYVRVFGTTNPDISTATLSDGLAKVGLSAGFEVSKDESVENWTVLGVFNSKNDIIIQIERDSVLGGELVGEEIQEFREKIKDCKPSLAAKWLDSYFDNIKVIYAFQLLSSSFKESNFPIVGAIKAAIWGETGGILQADNEGFSNEDGYHILWQFSDDVSGEWSMAVKNF